MEKNPEFLFQKVGRLGSQFRAFAREFYGQRFSVSGNFGHFHKTAILKPRKPLTYRSSRNAQALSQEAWRRFVLPHQRHEEEELAVCQVELRPEVPIGGGIQDVDEFVQRKSYPARVHEFS